MRIQLIFKRYRQLVVNKAENHQHGELIKHSTNAHMCMFCRDGSCIQNIKSPCNYFKSKNLLKEEKYYYWTRGESQFSITDISKNISYVDITCLLKLASNYLY